MGLKRLAKLFNFVVCNPCQSSPSLFLYGLLLSLCCFSTFVKYYFQVSFDLKVNLSMFKTDTSKYRDRAPLRNRLCSGAPSYEHPLIIRTTLWTILFVPTKSSYISSIKLTRLLRTLVNTDNRHFSVSPVTNSDTSLTQLYGQYYRKKTQQ